MLSLIVAVAANGVIGRENGMPWRLPNDLKRLKELTMGHTLIMGRRTFESLGRVLPGRMHVVLTGNTDYIFEHPMVRIVHDISELKEYIDSDEEAFIFGGAAIYKLLLPYAKRLYITEIAAEIEGDTFFPGSWREEFTEVSRVPEKNDDINTFTYDYVIYERRMPA